jgi:hypothetical protein
MQRTYLRGALALLVIAILVGGCGGGGDGSETYGEILHGLKRAAVAHRKYDAVGRAEDLKPTLKASLDAFCETNREMLMNAEAWKAHLEGYFVNRIKLRAERELPFVSTAPVAAAVGQYKELFDLASFDPDAVRRYDNACYHAKLWY